MKTRLSRDPRTAWTYPQAIRYLYGLQRSGMKFGLRNIRGLLRLLEEPQKKFRAVHVAGSNGKGSTAAMIAAMLTAAGYRTGLYTSPHLVSFEERIRINGSPIPKHDVTRLAWMLKPGIERYRATFFEAVTALAFEYFAEMKVEVAVVEVGLGGRLDATNVLQPLASVITEISLEHTEILGTSIRRIAYEKAGIVKKNVPCVTAVTSTAALSVIKDVCRQRNAPLEIVSRRAVGNIRSTIRGTTADFSIGGKRLTQLSVSLPGSFQIQNAALAVATILKLDERGLTIDEKALRKGLGRVRQLTGFRARLSVISRRPTIIADVAHNPQAAKRLARSLLDLGITKVTLLFGVMKDKRVEPMVRFLRPVVRTAIAVKPLTNRARSVEELLPVFRRNGIRARNGRGVMDGLSLARRMAGRRGTVLITGSHFVVGEALAARERRKYLTINQ